MFRILTVIGVLFCAAAASADDVVRFIDVHVHYVPSGPEFPAKSKLARKKRWSGIPAAELLENMDAYGIEKIINELPPTAIRNGGNQDDFGIPELAASYPDRVFVLYGGKALTLLYQAVEKGKDSPRHERKFVRQIERAMETGLYKGFGEIGLHHMETVKRGAPTIPADHPWMLKMADVAAKYGLPIDIHMEATDDTVPALERLLAHNGKARIVWAHAGWSELGHATADVWERLMTSHANLYGSIKHRARNSKHASPDVAIRGAFGGIEPDWLRLFEKFPDRFMIGSDIKPGVRVDERRQFQHIDHMQAFLNELPPHLRGPIARDNAIRVFNLAAGGGL